MYLYFAIDYCTKFFQNKVPWGSLKGAEKNTIELHRGECSIQVLWWLTVT